MSARTIFLRKLIRLYCIIVALAMLAQKQAIVSTVAIMLHDAPAMLLLGILTTIAGLAMALAHNVWTGGAAPVIITLAGWATLLKGLSLLFFPISAAPDFYLRTLHYEQLFYFYAGIPLLLGIYLAYSGFTSAPR